MCQKVVLGHGFLHKIELRDSAFGWIRYSEDFFWRGGQAPLHQTASKTNEDCVI